MKYSHEIIIDLPREKVIELFNNQENAFKWMKGLKSWDHVSGEPGQEGAKSKMLFESRNRTIEIHEEITRKDLPDIINFVFTSKGVKNWNDNHFEAISDNQTKWVQSNVFKCKGTVWIFSKLMPGAFKKQSHATMVDFKNFAEEETESR